MLLDALQKMRCICIPTVCQEYGDPVTSNDTQFMKSAYTIIKEKIPAKVICLALALAFIAPYNTIDAQIPVGELLMRSLPKKDRSDTADRVCHGQFCGQVFISPTTVNIHSDSVKGDTVVITLELSNRTDTVITGTWKSYDVLPPQVIPLDSPNAGTGSGKKVPSLLAGEDGDISESSGEEMSLSTWLSGFPESVVIEPHSTIKMNVIVRVPKGLKEGSYTAWLGAMSQTLVHRSPPQKPTRIGIISRVKITYDTKAVNNNIENR